LCIHFRKKEKKKESEVFYCKNKEISLPEILKTCLSKLDITFSLYIYKLSNLNVKRKLRGKSKVLSLWIFKISWYNQENRVRSWRLESINFDNKIMKQIKADFEK
jgi:hypothetical protein